MKACSRCGLEKKPSAFGFKSKQLGKRHSYCKVCQRQLSKAHYRANRRKYLERNKARNTKQRGLIRRFLAAYFANHPCVDCGEQDIRVLECDHVRGEKLRGIGHMLSQTASLAVLRREIAKCVVRCCNCHARKTAISRGSWRAIAYDSTPA